MAAELTSNPNRRREGEVGGLLLTCVNLVKFESLKLKKKEKEKKNQENSSNYSD